MKETGYFLKIEIDSLYPNPNHKTERFDWIRGGNVALGISVAKQYVEKNIPPNQENKYTAHIKIKDNKTDATVFEWNHRRGNLRLSLDVADEYISQKLGFNLHDQIKKALDEGKPPKATS